MEVFINLIGYCNSMGDAVVVLGDKLRFPDRLHERLERKVDHGISAYLLGFAPLLILTGGATGPAADGVTEAGLMAAHAAQKGVPNGSILTEKVSQDTLGNAYFIRRLADEQELRLRTIYVVANPGQAARADIAFHYAFPHADVKIQSLSPQGITERASSALENIVGRVHYMHRLAGIQPGHLDAIGEHLMNSPKYRAVTHDSFSIHSPI